MKISFYRIGSWFIIWILKQNRTMTHNLWVITIPEVHRKFILSLLYSFLFKYFISVLPKSRTPIVRAAWADKIKYFLEFVCEDSFGVACPSGVDKDLWSRFQAFEKWNATHWVIFMTSFQHVINPIFYLTFNRVFDIRIRRTVCYIRYVEPRAVTDSQHPNAFKP